MTRTRNVKNTTKFKRSIKAISPVIATLLMIAIAVVASLVVYAWVSGYIGFQTNNAGQAIQIQSYSPGTDPNTMDIYVQNVGQGEVKVGGVYLNDAKVDPTQTDLTITKGATIKLTVPTTWIPGEEVDIKVTTTSGTFSEIKGTGPSGGSSLPKYTLIVNPSTQGDVVKSPNQAQYSHGTTVMLTATATVDGYTFVSWSGDVPAADANSNPVTIIMDSNKVVTPTFVQTPYSLTTDTDGSGRGTITPDAVAPYTFNQIVRLTAETDISSTFGGWTGDGTVDSQNPLVYIVQLNGDKTATASFTIKTVTITPQTVTNGAITPSTVQTVNYGTDSPTFTVTASTAGNGYRIINVFDGTTVLGGAGLTSFQYTFQNVIANHQISATFEPIPITHAVHFAMDTVGQSITPTVGDYTYIDGEVVQLGATADGTHHFDHWTATGTGTTITFDDATKQDAKATISSPGTITAIFHANTAPSHIHLDTDEFDQIIVGDHVHFQGYLQNAANLGINGKTISFTLTGPGGITRTTTPDNTNIFGYFDSNPSQALDVAGSWTATANFAGDTTYDQSQTSYTFTVAEKKWHAESMTQGQTISEGSGGSHHHHTQVIITVVDPYGNPLGDNIQVQVTWTVNNVPNLITSADTNDDGQATIVSPPDNTNQYQFTVTAINIPNDNGWSYDATATANTITLPQTLNAP